MDDEGIDLGARSRKDPNDVVDPLRRWGIAGEVAPPRGSRSLRGSTARWASRRHLGARPEARYSGSAGIWCAAIETRPPRTRKPAPVTAISFEASRSTCAPR